MRVKIVTKHKSNFTLLLAWHWHLQNSKRKLQAY